LSRSVRKRRDRQLYEAVEAVNCAIRAIDKFVALWEKHLTVNSDLRAWAKGVKTDLLRQRAQVETYRSQAAAWPSVRGKLGAPKRPTSYLLEVLAAYFGRNHWPVSAEPKALFAEVAFTVLGTQSMNYKLLRSLSVSSLDYAALEEGAPKGVAPAL